MKLIGGTMKGSMRYLLVFGLVLIFSVAAFAREDHPGKPENPGSQGNGNKDNQNDDGPILAGFAIITPLPSSTTGGSMTVFATFGRKNGGDFEQAGVVPPGLTTSAVVFVSSSGRLSRNLGVAIVNPNNGTADVTMNLRYEDGSVIGTKQFTIGGHKQVSKLVTELYTDEIPRDLTGTLVITSTQPIAITGLRFRGANFSSLPVTNLLPVPGALPSPSAGIGGAGAVLLPQFVAGGGWATEVVIANTGTAAMSVRLDLFKQDGSALETKLNGTNGSTLTGLTIPAGGVITIAPRNHDGDSDF
jgi:hypothetical protein